MKVCESNNDRVLFDLFDIILRQTDEDRMVSRLSI